MKLPPTVVFVVGIVAGILEIVNRVVLSASSTSHAVIGLVLMFIVGLGLVPLTGEQLGKLIPLHVAVVLTSAAGVLQVLQQENLGGGSVLHSIIGVVLLVLAAVGIAPATEHALSAPGLHRRRL